MSGFVTCPYCKADEIDPRGLASHVRMCDDDIHGSKFDVPDDFEEQIDEHIAKKHAKKIDFRNIDTSEIDTEADDTGPAYCNACGSRDLHELDDGEPISMDGQVIGHGDDGDVICVECGEIVKGEVTTE